MKALFIVGATATGKTKLAVAQSKLTRSVLISADSRQVYRDMDIVTGKDQPEGTQLFGIDLCSPRETYSVSEWCDSVTKIIASNSQKLPIIVGGTGLYVKSLISPPDTLHIPINQELRDELNMHSVAMLQNTLKKHNSSRFSIMNHSDASNPRRLVRAIEVEVYLGNKNQSNIDKPSISFDSKIIGLLPPTDPEVYKAMIRERVIARLSLGAVEETKSLLSKYDKALPSFTAIGYRSLITYLQNKLTYDQMIEEWVNDEHAYAKRQQLYLNKLDSIKWYDAQTNNLNDLVAQTIKTWYDNR